MNIFYLKNQKIIIYMQMIMIFTSSRILIFLQRNLPITWKPSGRSAMLINVCLMFNLSSSSVVFSTEEISFFFHYFKSAKSVFSYMNHFIISVKHCLFFPLKMNRAIHYQNHSIMHFLLNIRLQKLISCFNDLLPIKWIFN